jgi:DinB superfamily
MNLIDFYRVEQRRLHTALRAAVSDLTPQEWNHTAAETGNSIAFLMWHGVRTEDNILRSILQGRATAWQEGNWHERLGLPPKVQGTGMASDEARALRIIEPALFMQYAGQVWQEYEDYLAAIDDGGAALSERLLLVKPLGNLPAIQAIGQVCLSHLFMHYGELPCCVA